MHIVSTAHCCTLACRATATRQDIRRPLEPLRKACARSPRRPGVAWCACTVSEVVGHAWRPRRPCARQERLLLVLPRAAVKRIDRQDETERQYAAPCHPCAGTLTQPPWQHAPLHVPLCDADWDCVGDAVRVREVVVRADALWCAAAAWLTDRLRLRRCWRGCGGKQCCSVTQCASTPCLPSTAAPLSHGQMLHAAADGPAVSRSTYSSISGLVHRRPRRSASAHGSPTWPPARGWSGRG